LRPAHTCAVVADGTARCWGGNASGQLGDGTTTNRSVPTAVSGLTNAVATDAVATLTCATLADGTARCWGSNVIGQLGDGTIVSRRTLPTTVTTLSGQPPTATPLGALLLIAGGSDHKCAAQSTGAVLRWGRGVLGQIGNGTTANQLRAVAVPSFTLNIDPVVASPRRGREAEVTILANCDVGQRLHVEVRLIQDRTVARCAARSTCGKPTAVLCCVSQTGTCSDQAPGNMMPEGTCGNDVEIACDVDADCSRMRARIARDEAACTASSGTPAGQGTVCEACATSGAP